MALKYVLFGLLATVAVAAASDVLVLTEDNFDKTLEDNEVVLVEFYAPWCGHCKSLAPEYEKAATAMKDAEPAVALAKVDATAERELAERFEVRGFPTLKFFRNGKPSDYGGGRTDSTIVSWLKKKTGPAAATLADVDAAEKFIDSGDVTVVGFFDDDSADAKAEFEKAAYAEEEIAFAATSDAAAFDKYKVTAPAVVIFQKFDEGRADLEGDITAEAISEHVSANALPLVVPFSQENAPKIFGGAIKIHMLVFSDTDADEHEGFVAEAKGVAVENKGKLLVVTVDKSDSRILDFFGLEEGDLPTARLVTMGEGSMRKFVFEGKLTADELNQFAADFFDGKLKPHLKSEDVPEDNDGPVTVIVGKNFDDIVMDDSKDVLIEFYAPWCGHCKRLVPVWDALGEKFKDVDSVVIAKMDATANEHEAVDVSGFPTIKFFPAGKKDSPVDYDGSRDEEGFVAFLEDNAKESFELGESEGKDEL